MHQPTLELENPLWRFALTLWQNPDLQTHLMRLQNLYGQRVNSIIAAAWYTGRPNASASSLRQATVDTLEWHIRHVRPLRSERLALASHESERKKALLAQELEAEQIEIARLYAILNQTDFHKVSTPDSLDRLLRSVCVSEIPEHDIAKLNALIQPVLTLHNTETKP